MNASDPLEFETIRTAMQGRGAGLITLNRPEVHNAFNETMIAELSRALAIFCGDDSLRTLTIAGAGKSFCAGADLNWMRRTADFSEQQNYADALRMAAMLDRLQTFPKPTIAVVHGNVFGGGVGLAACCDIAIAEQSAVFSLSEVKLGLIPATISPYVSAAIGSRHSRRYFLTGERFDAATAQKIGLIHEYGDGAAIREIEAHLMTCLLAGGPQAQTAAKQLIQELLTAPQIDASLRQAAAKSIASARASAEGREGIRAFLEKREPRWPGR